VLFAAALVPHIEMRPLAFFLILTSSVLSTLASAILPAGQGPRVVYLPHHEHDGGVAESALTEWHHHTESSWRPEARNTLSAQTTTDPGPLPINQILTKLDADIKGPINEIGMIDPPRDSYPHSTGYRSEYQ
jgi:hypothetical protein